MSDPVMLCPSCKGSKETDRTSFADPTKILKESCKTCRGRGELLNKDDLIYVLYDSLLDLAHHHMEVSCILGPAACSFHMKAIRALQTYERAKRLL